MKQFISTDKAPAAIGPYSQGVIAQGSIIAVSGQLPIDPAKGEFAGDTIEAQTEQSIRNIAAILAEAGATLDDVFKTTVYLDDINDFVPMNEVYARFFGEGLPARAAVEVANLPKGAKVEIEALAVK